MVGDLPEVPDRNVLLHRVTRKPVQPDHHQLLPRPVQALFKAVAGLLATLAAGNGASLATPGA
jgi:hypothetical protein